MQHRIRWAAWAGALMVSSLLLAAASTAPDGASSHSSSGGWNSSRSDTATIVEVRSTGVELTFDRAEIAAKAGETLTIRYTNHSDEMTHNIVVVKREEDIRPVGIAALKAHESEYIPPDEMERIIAFSELAAPGETVEFTFQVPPAGTYPFICTYSGHFTTMQGRLISTP